MANRGLWAAALVAGLAGFLAGRWTAPAPEPTRAPASRVAEHRPAPTPAAPIPSAAPAPTRGLEDEANVARLRDVAEHAVALGADARDLAGTLVQTLEDEAIVSMVVSLTDFTREELEEVDDMRGFVERLTEIAMDGTVVPAEEPPPGVRGIDFATRLDGYNRAAEVRGRFAPDENRIYAAFESDGWEADSVLVKWTRMRDGEILLMKRHRIDPTKDSNFVWLEASGAHWDPGEYRVDIYEPGDRLSMLASGRHRVE